MLYHDNRKVGHQEIKHYKEYNFRIIYNNAQFPVFFVIQKFKVTLFLLCMSRSYHKEGNFNH